MPEEKSTEKNTITVETPGGHTVELKKEMTGRDYRELSDTWMKDVIVEGTANDPKNMKATGMKGTVENEARQKAFELMVVSLDGSTENIVDRIYDLPLSEYDVIVEAVDKITKVLDEKKRN